MSNFSLQEILTFLEESIRDRDVVKFSINCDRLGFEAPLDNTTARLIFDWLNMQLYNPDFHSFPEDAVLLLAEIFGASRYQDYVDEQQLALLWKALTENTERFRELTVCLFLEELAAEIFPQEQTFAWLMQLAEKRIEPSYIAVPSALYQLSKEVDDHHLIEDISDALKILSKSADAFLMDEALLYYKKILRTEE